MILPANISNMLIQHLSLSHDEHMGAIRQHANGLMNNVTGQSARQVNNMQINQVSANVLNNIPNGGVTNFHGVSRLNELPILNSSLQTEATKAAAAGKYATDNAVTEKQSDEEGNERQQRQYTKGDLQLEDDQSLTELLEIQALQTIVETTCAIQSSSAYKSLFVSLVYSPQRAEASENQSNGQLMTVSPLQQHGGQILAHTTLLMSVPGGDIKTRQLASQIVFGHPTDASDWMFARMEHLEIYSEAAWRIEATGFNRELVGVALVLGDDEVFRNPWVEISVHVPGINQIWNSTGGSSYAE